MKDCPHDLREFWHLTGMGEMELKVYHPGKGFVLQPSLKGVRLKAFG